MLTFIDATTRLTHAGDYAQAPDNGGLENPITPNNLEHVNNENSWLSVQISSRVATAWRKHVQFVHILALLHALAPRLFICSPV